MSLLSIRLLLCVLMYVNLGLVGLFSSRKQKKHVSAGARNGGASRTAANARPGCCVPPKQAQSIIKVLVLFHRERQTFLFSLLLSFRFVCVSAPAGRSFGKGVWRGEARPLLFVLPISFSLMGSKQSSGRPVNRLVSAITFRGRRIKEWERFTPIFLRAARVKPHSVPLRDSRLSES